jgi:hypothetical protein
VLFFENKIFDKIKKSKQSNDGESNGGEAMQSQPQSQSELVSQVSASVMTRSTNNINTDIDKEGGMSLRILGKDVNQWFVLRGVSLEFWPLEADRSVSLAAGVVRLRGATVNLLASRKGKGKRQEFSIAHPGQLTPFIFSCDDSNDARQWQAKICAVVEAQAEIEAQLKPAEVCHEGSLFFKVGQGTSDWQEYWCMLRGQELKYFSTALATEASGAIRLGDGCSARLTPSRGWHHTFELIQPKGKGRAFYAEMEEWRTEWVAAINASGATGKAKTNNGGSAKQSKGRGTWRRSITGALHTSNPLLSTATPEHRLTESKLIQPALRSGFMEKKSPTMLRGWQRRYFEIRVPGQ